MHNTLGFIQQHLIGIGSVLAAAVFTRLVSGVIIKLMAFALIGTGIYYALAGVPHG